MINQTKKTIFRRCAMSESGASVNFSVFFCENQIKQTHKQSRCLEKNLKNLNNKKKTSHKNQTPKMKRKYSTTF